MNRRILTLQLTIFISVNVFSQTANYSFIDKEKNRLYFSSDSSAIMGLYSRLDKLRRGENIQVRIAHIGGSHVQAGTWSNAFLTDFQNEFRSAGGGYFVFPYRIAKTNGQPFATSYSNGTWRRCRSIGKEFCQPLGMNGLSITTNDSLNNFGLALTCNSTCRKANFIKVYHNFNNSFEFGICLKDTQKFTRMDDPSAGYTAFKLEAPVDSVNFELHRKDTIQRDFILFGFSMENEQVPGFYLAGLGANGASSASFLRCDYLSKQFATLNADLVILSLGVNDTQSKGYGKEEFIEHYDSLITIIKKTNPNTAIILTTTTDNYIRRRTPNKRSISARDAMYELMTKHNIAVWDLFSIMGGYRSIVKWQNAGLASKDRVHFTNKGYTLAGHLLFEALNRSYLNYLKKT